MYALLDLWPISTSLAHSLRAQGRYMLTNVGSSSLNAAAVALAGIQEVALRASLSSVDAAFRRLRGDREAPSPAQTRRLRRAWASAIVTATVLEYRRVCCCCA